MSERYNTITVFLGEPYSEDEAKELLSAIGQLRGVSIVKLGVPDSIEQEIARSQFRTATGCKINAFIRKEIFGWSE